MRTTIPMISGNELDVFNRYSRPRSGTAVIAATKRAYNKRERAVIRATIRHEITHHLNTI